MRPQCEIYSFQDRTTEGAHNIIPFFFAATSVYNLFTKVIKVNAACKFNVLNRIAD